MTYLLVILFIGVTVFVYVYGRSKFYLVLGIGRMDEELDQAVANFQRAIEINPNEAKAHNFLGLGYRRQGKIDEAIAEHRKAIDIDPNVPHAHYYLGEAYEKKGKLTEAIATFKQALEINPNETELPNRLNELDRQMRISNLMNLSKDTASKDSHISSDSKETAFKCIEIMREATTYQSRLVIKELLREDLKSTDYVSTKWDFSFVSPDRFQVRQVAYPYGELDQWTTIGQEHYQFPVVGQFPDARNDELNRFLLVNKFLEVLRTAEPISQGVYHYRERQYSLLEYKATSVVALDAFAEFLGWSSHDGVTCTYQVHMWIDSANGILAKGEIVAEGQSQDGENIHEVLQQVFTSYNEDIQMTAPPGFLGKS